MTYRLVRLVVTQGLNADDDADGDDGGGGGGVHDT